MKNKSIVGSIFMLCAVILFSTIQICEYLSSVATATMGFVATSSPSNITLAMYAASAIFAVIGIAFIVCDFIRARNRDV